MTRRRTFFVLLLAATGCGELLSFGEDDPPAPISPDAAASDASTNAEVFGSEGSAEPPSDPCTTPPSFCEGFDDATLSSVWTKVEQNGGYTVLLADGELGGSLRSNGSLVLDPDSGTQAAPTYALVARQVMASVRSLDCTFRARADAISWNNTFDIMVVQSGETPGYSDWFASIWAWDSDIGASITAQLSDGGGPPGEYPRGQGKIAPDVWIDVSVRISSADGWILHGSIGDAKIDRPLPVPGPALVNPILRFGMHYGLLEDGTTTMHVDIDRLVCRITPL